MGPVGQIRRTPIWYKWPGRRSDHPQSPDGRALWANERLFFKLYGQALQGRPHTGELIERVVEDWIEPVVEVNVAGGMPEQLVRAQARLGVAITRGLLLDLLSTGDIGAVDQAMDAFIDLYELWLAKSERLWEIDEPQQ